MGDNPEKLQQALSQLKDRGMNAGMVINTQRLWRQSNYVPPDQRSQAIRHRQSEFKAWREEAFQQYQEMKQHARYTPVFFRVRGSDDTDQDNFSFRIKLTAAEQDSKAGPAEEDCNMEAVHASKAPRRPRSPAFPEHTGTGIASMDEDPCMRSPRCACDYLVRASATCMSEHLSRFASAARQSASSGVLSTVGWA